MPEEPEIQSTGVDLPLEVYEILADAATEAGLSVDGFIEKYAVEIFADLFSANHSHGHGQHTVVKFLKQFFGLNGK